MLYAGSDDGVYRLEGVGSGDDATAEHVLDAERVYRVRQFDGLAGLFAAGESGLYHSLDGDEWRPLHVPEDSVYAVSVSPAGDRLYAGTRPAHVFTADTTDGLPAGSGDWQALPGFEALRERADWGLPRHDGRAQVRSLRTHPDAPDRIVAGLEVGGLFLSDDGGENWTGRHVSGFDAPHTDDIHHLAQGTCDEFVAATGSGLYRTADAGRTWERLDTGYSQAYFRESLVHDGTVYAGGAHGPSPTWDEDTDHGLFERREGQPVETVPSPVLAELAIGWCGAEEHVLAATHRGTVLRREDDGYRVVGTVPTPGPLRGRYLPLTWFES